MAYEDLSRERLEAEIADLHVLKSVVGNLIEVSRTVNLRVEADLEDFFNSLDDVSADHLEPLIKKAEAAEGELDARDHLEHVRQERAALYE